MKDWIDLIARIFIATIFFYEAVDTIWYFNDARDILESYGVMWLPGVWVTGGILLLLLGATLVSLGYLSGLGAFLLLIYLLPYTFIVHSFWNDPAEIQRIQALLFMNKIGLCGGLLLIIVNKSGKYSVRRLIHVMRLPK